MTGPKHLITFVVGMCFGLHVICQTEQTVLTQFTTADGLSFNSVRGIHQDARGYMYFQTWKGMDCFDGIEFKNFQCFPERSMENGHSFAEDSLGNLWYGRILSRYSTSEESPDIVIVRVNGGEEGIYGIRNILLGPDQLLYLNSLEELMRLDPYAAELILDTLCTQGPGFPFKQITRIRFDKNDGL